VCWFPRRHEFPSSSSPADRRDKAMSDDRFKAFKQIQTTWNDEGDIFHEGDRLILSTEELYRPTITVKLRTKWYAIYLVHTTTGWCLRQALSKGYFVYEVHYGHLDGVTPHGTPPFRDHVPNPDAVRLFARRNEFEVDELASDLI